MHFQWRKAKSLWNVNPEHRELGLSYDTFSVSLWHSKVPVAPGAPSPGTPRAALAEAGWQRPVRIPLCVTLRSGRCPCGLGVTVVEWLKSRQAWSRGFGAPAGLAGPAGPPLGKQVVLCASPHPRSESGVQRFTWALLTSALLAVTLWLCRRQPLARKVKAVKAA